MYQTIVIPLDGSQLAERALPMAVTLARATGARLALVRAVRAPGLPGLDLARASTQAVKEADDYLHGVAEWLAKQGISAGASAQQGLPAETILSEVMRQSADLVVMSTHGRSGLGRWVYGSVAEAVLAESPVPVLLVRAAAPEAALAPEATPPRLLVPLDGSALAEAALSPARNLARALGATVVLVRALTLSPAVSGEMALAAPSKQTLETELPGQRAAEAEGYLREVSDRLAHDGLRSSVVVRSGPAVDTILGESRAGGVSLIVMATHGRTGLSRLLFGSIAAQVLHRGELPVLLVRPLDLVED